MAASAGRSARTSSATLTRRPYALGPREPETDVVFTTETHMNTDGLVRSATYQLNVESVEAPDPYTVVFNLKNPNSRFHALFTVRWNAAWVMPKHVFEGQDPLEFDFNPPVSLGAYTLRSFDPNGAWYIWEKREDWERTTVAQYGEPAPQYIIYRSIPVIDNRLIELLFGLAHRTQQLFGPIGMFLAVLHQQFFQRLIGQAFGPLRDRILSMPAGW